MIRCAAIIVAAGRGQRFGGDGPKQYQDLAGEPLLRRTLRTFAAHPLITDIVPVIHADDTLLYTDAIAGISGGQKITSPVIGGTTRQDSVRNGLESLASDPPDIVLIHDGARPMNSERIIGDVIAALTHADGALPTLPVVDTLKRISDGDRVGATVPRDDIAQAQTPQGFRYASILDAHRQMAKHTFTDDAAVMEKHGGKVISVPGDAANIKVTTMEDLSRLNEQLAEIRVGQGFDVHKFGAGDSVWLCGVKVPHSHGLEGHSDADVALHAATDAILGSIGAGDIGQHFPSSDPTYRNASSDRFIAHAYHLLGRRGGILVHLDITIICERPKVGPHREAFVARIAEILNVPPSRISIKATTTEGLGFTGRREGIAAQATATVRVPARV